METILKRLRDDVSAEFIMKLHFILYPNKLASATSMMQ